MDFHRASRGFVKVSGQFANWQAGDGGRLRACQALIRGKIYLSLLRIWEAMKGDPRTKGTRGNHEQIAGVP